MNREIQHTVAWFSTESLMKLLDGVFAEHEWPTAFNLVFEHMKVAIEGYEVMALKDREAKQIAPSVN